MSQSGSVASVVKTRLVNDDIWYYSFNGTITNLRDLLYDPETYLGIAFDPYSPITITFVYTLEGEDEDGLRETYVAEGVLGTNFITVNCPISIPIDRYADVDRELEDYLRIPKDSFIDVKWINTPKIAYAHYDPLVKIENESYDRHSNGHNELDLLENTAQLIRRPELLPPFLSRRAVRGKFVQNRLDPSATNWAVTDVAKSNIKVAFRFPDSTGQSFRFVYQTVPKIKCISNSDLIISLKNADKHLSMFCKKMEGYEGLSQEIWYFVNMDISDESMYAETVDKKADINPDYNYTMNTSILKMSNQFGSFPRSSHSVI